MPDAREITPMGGHYGLLLTLTAQGILDFLIEYPKELSNWSLGRRP